MWFSKMTCLWFMLCCILGSWASQEYLGHKVYRVIPRNGDELQQLQNLQMQYDAVLDFWRDPSSVGKPVDIMLTPTLEQEVLAHLENLDAKIMINNVQQLVDNERRDDSEFLNSFNRYDEIVEWLQEKCNGDDSECTLENIGQSYEGRDMYVAQIGDNDDGKPIIFLECGIHSREWIAPAVCLNMIDTLINEDSEAVELRGYYNWQIIVVANPDGYEYTFGSGNRMWRKTRSPNSGSSCMGCDPNRNFDYEWGGAGTSNNPCSDLFRGPSNFSEVETQNIRDYVTPRQERIRAYYAVHSYGQYFLIPWSYARNVYPEDYADMLEVGQKGRQAIITNSGRDYNTGQSADLLGATAGCSDDWAKGTCGIKFAYTVELRDTGSYGFIAPESEIAPNFDEIWDSFVAMCRFMNSNYTMAV